MRRIRTAVIVVALVAALAACGTSDNGVAKTGLADSASGSSGASSASTGSSSSAPAPTNVTIQVGINAKTKPNIAVLQYMPAKVTVEVGAPVDFVWDGTIEPHSVTFLAPNQTLPAPGSDPTLFTPTPATGPIDGSTFVNSGLQPLGPVPATPASFTFAKAGDYQFHCVIHPQMVGTVTVVDKGGSGVDTPAAAQKRGADEMAQWLDEGTKAEAAFAKQTPKQTANADGSSTWQIEMGTSTAHTDILEFAPAPANIKAGDSVTFVNNSGAPHTASFFNKQPPIVSPLDPATDAPAPGPSPQTLDDTNLFNTGLLPPNSPPGSGPPEAARSFTFKVPAKGTYAYICILHSASSMQSQVVAA